jgi:hypothetical protein
LHEARPIGEAEFVGKPARGVDRRCREVKSDDGGAALGQFQAVGAEMTLRVQDTAALDRPQVRLFDGVEAAASGPQTCRIVTARAEMQGDLLIPMGPVGRPPYRPAYTANSGRTIPRWPCCRRL